ncbi:Structural maintenance of chromosomes protein 2 [Trichinella patagoniensis]|uniref:Structural maintenance of chromosomes protein n=1 Tax=Trichinella patagoniensis TaxID=990121 RepID=A0A0V0Z7F1_9BILA|nr:Structural maintenance of chromosomes protein 2 [Trichinella patagoniensis]
MHLKRIELEGFKSYRQRTILDNFNPNFNAITGLNGSGKSNILDAICFVLGITNLNHVRAASLQDLVSDYGKTGIERASVSVVFDNSNRARSPCGYENYDEIVISRVIVSGQQKCFLNGSICPISKIIDLFRSIHMNVNNPHFLIMQGRITKVLNMKPLELLSMMEEATGTKMYESKRQVAEHLIHCKEKKFKENERLLVDAVMPKIKKLNKQKDEYNQLKLAKSKLGMYERLVAAYQYHQAKENISKFNTLKESSLKSIDSEQKIMACKQEKYTEIEVELKALKKKQGQCTALTKLQEELSECNKDECSAQSVYESKVNALKKLEEYMQSLSDHIAKTEKNKADKNEMYAQRKQAVEEEEDQFQRLKDSAKQYQIMCDVLQNGMTVDTEGKAFTMASCLTAAQGKLTSIEVEKNSLEMKIAEAKKKLKKNKKMQDTAIPEQKQLISDLDRLEKEVQNLESSIAALQFDQHQLNEMNKSYQQLSDECHSLEVKLRQLESQFPSLEIRFSEQTPEFDRNKIKGRVAELIRIKNPRMAVALDVTAGGKLYSVVIDSSETVRMLNDAKCLKQRTTFLPLDAVESKVLNRDVIRRAKSLVGDENCNLAADLVECVDPEFQKAIDHVFGTTLVCTNSEMAKTVCFDKGVRARTVTLDGDVFSPLGTLTGGSKPSGGYLLEMRVKNQSIHDEFRGKKNQLEKTLKTLHELRAVAQKHSALEGELQMQLMKKNNAAQRLQSCQAAQLEKECESLKTEIDEASCRLNSVNEDYDATKRQCNEISAAWQNSKVNKEAELSKAKKSLKEATKKVSHMEEIVTKHQEELSRLENDIEVLTNDIENAKQEKLRKELEKEELQTAVKDSKFILDGRVNSTKVIEEQLRVIREKLKNENKDAEDMQNEVQQLQQECRDSELRLKQMQQDLNEQQKAAEKYENDLINLCNSNPWIEKEKQLFGVAGTEFDFEANNPGDAAKRLVDAHETIKRLQGHVDKRNVEKCDVYQKEVTDLIRKRKVVYKDRQHLEDVMNLMQEKKREAVAVALEQVNEDFGQIFSMLLPGANAKLVRISEEDILAGLEVKVAFGDAWKESLTELSGGQRSLIALSLIFAMLLFKPAPIYILDEVDAALDVMHTQNIGKMISEKFKTSQFIVVSLKDGMFSNANVLFRTELRNGQSKVQRIAKQIPTLETVSRSDVTYEQRRKKAQSRVQVLRDDCNRLTDNCEDMRIVD